MLTGSLNIQADVPFAASRSFARKASRNNIVMPNV